MKKLIWLLVLIVPISLSCKKKSAEVEMKLPTPIPTSTPIALSPTAVTTEEPTPTTTPSLQYSIEDIKGTALIIPAGSTIPETAEEGEAVETGDNLLTKEDSEITLALNDNTLIHIPADSQIRVVDLSPNTIHGFSSRIELILGNILSEVEKLNESKSSFEIEAGGVVCGVRGTAFEVQNRDGNVSTSTYHGVVVMKKGAHIQTVRTNDHSTFSLKQTHFLPQRSLTLAEKKRYKVWQKTKTAVQQKRAIRMNNGVPPAPVKKTPPLMNKRPTKIVKHKPLAKPRPFHAAITPGGKNKKAVNSRPLKQKQAPARIQSRPAAKPMARPKTATKPSKPSIKQPPKKKKKN